MQLSEFDYNLPKELIAQTPLQKRDNSKLLIVDKESGQLSDNKFSDLLNILWKWDILVVNKTRVINARLKWYIKINNSSSYNSKWQKKVEIFLHKQIADNTWDCLVYPWKKLKVWTKVYFRNTDSKSVKIKQKLQATIKSVSESWRTVEFNKWWIEFLKIIEMMWEVPLPPYIKEKLTHKERYQTVYNENPEVLLLLLQDFILQPIY